jgi:hypothetical protein
MSTVVEGSKIRAWPLAALAPGLVNNIASGSTASL